MSTFCQLMRFLQRLEPERGNMRTLLGPEQSTQCPIFAFYITFREEPSNQQMFIYIYICICIYIYINICPVVFVKRSPPREQVTKRHARQTSGTSDMCVARIPCKLCFGFYGTPVVYLICKGIPAPLLRKLVATSKPGGAAGLLFTRQHYRNDVVALLRKPKHCTWAGQA